MISFTPDVGTSTYLNGATQGKVAAHSTGSSTGSSSSSAADSASSIQTTFLSLLAEELQNQDPTTPVDSTQMVGQMISLNQLNQLVDINQTLSQASTTTSTP